MQTASQCLLGRPTKPDTNPGGSFLFLSPPHTGKLQLTGRYPLYFPGEQAGGLFTINPEVTLDTTQILDDLKTERDRIGRAIAALEGRRRFRRPRRPPSTPAAKTSKPKRRMSAAGKKRISEAAKKRWAVWRTKNA
jgi:hypothetical protein